MPRSTGPFRRFVQIGRVALINYGKLSGKHVVIIDVLDQNRAFVDGPTSGVSRQVINFKRLSLTDFVLPITRGINATLLKKAIEKENLHQKWSETAWAKRLEIRKTRAAASDFDRFKVLLAKKERGLILKTTVAKMLKDEKKAKKGKKVAVKKAEK